MCGVFPDLSARVHSAERDHAVRGRSGIPRVHHAGLVHRRSQRRRLLSGQLEVSIRQQLDNIGPWNGG